MFQLRLCHRFLVERIFHKTVGWIRLYHAAPIAHGGLALARLAFAKPRREKGLRREVVGRKVTGNPLEPFRRLGQFAFLLQQMRQPVNRVGGQV